LRKFSADGFEHESLGNILLSFSATRVTLLILILTALWLESACYFVFFN